LSSVPLTPEEKSRYSRHLLLREVGVVGQERLKGSSVLCVGAGGLGSPVLLYLAAAGVGRIGVIDFDAVEDSNLQRQVLYGTADVGESKAVTAGERVNALNPRVQVDVYNEALTVENVLERIEPYDLVIDGTDNFPTRYLVSDACEMLGRPYVYGSIYKFEGQVSVFGLPNGPRYRDLFPTPPLSGTVPSCGEAGVLGVLPGVIGVLQATEALKILLGLGSNLSGRLLLYDALAMTFREIGIRRDPDRPPVTSLVESNAGCRVEDPLQESRMYTQISVEDLKTRLDDGWTPFVLDVRWAHEAEIASLPFVDRLHPFDQVMDIADDLPKDRDLVVSCRSGGRSAKACMTLAALGFTRLYNLEGGIGAWSDRIDPSIPKY
jgi:molybdopterin/thiamine biosynthesis adenylyltransferase/rhodanese-related sulfurtransferase